MKYLFYLFMMCTLITNVPFAAQAAPHRNLSQQIQKAVDNHLSPLALKLASQGNTKGLAQFAKTQSIVTVLNTRDVNNNNLLHVAKNAATVQLVAALIRQEYGSKAQDYLDKMINQKNKLGQTALFAQVDAGHPDTFRILYPHAALKALNDKNSSCAAIRAEASDYTGETLFQAAQKQAPNNPEMARLARYIQRTMPCLTAN